MVQEIAKLSEPIVSEHVEMKTYLSISVKIISMQCCQKLYLCNVVKVNNIIYDMHQSKDHELFKAKMCKSKISKLAKIYTSIAPMHLSKHELVVSKHLSEQQRGIKVSTCASATTTSTYTTCICSPFSTSSTKMHSIKRCRSDRYHKAKHYSSSEGMGRPLPHR